MFNLEKSAVFEAVRLEKDPLFRFASLFKKVFFLLSLLFLVLKLWGLFLIFLDLAVAYYLLDCFFNSAVKHPKLKVKIEKAITSPQEYNLADLFSFEVAKAIYTAENDETRLLYNLITQQAKLRFVFYRCLLNPKEIRKLLLAHLRYSSRLSENLTEKKELEFQRILEESLKIARKRGKERIEMGDVLISLARNNPVFKKILVDARLKPEDIENVVEWLERIEQRIQKRKRFWEKENLLRLGSIGKNWATGYTPTLDRFSTDISAIARRKFFFSQMVGKQTALEEVERILSEREINNVLLVGQPGSGRRSLIEFLALKSFLGQSLPEVNYKRFLQLDLSSLSAEAEDMDECEVLLEAVFRETARAGNIVLVIDRFHNFIRSKLAPGMPNITGALVPYLSLPQFQIIAVTNYVGLHKEIEAKPSILDFFQKVEVPGVSEKEALLILEDMSAYLEFRYKKFISYQALRDIVRYCSEYFPSLPFPEKAIKVLDEAVIHISQEKEKVLSPKDVATVLSQKLEIPLGEMEAREKKVLLKLEELIHQRIVDQEEAVREIASSLRRARAEISTRNKPMGSFLFLGPTGVGKTETAKALSEYYFGSEKRIIRIDMSEFQQIKDISRLIGSPEHEEGVLTTAVRENPFSLVLLDEIEKAHPDILNLFLQVLDEGFLTDGVGRKVYFRHTIIIATSNAGSDIILERLKEKTDWSEFKEKLLGYLFEKGLFRPEFINRFDGVVVFKPLKSEDLPKIAHLLLEKIKKGLKEKGIDFIITEALKKRIAELSYKPEFGAREMRRVIQRNVENPLASALLSGKLKEGDRVEIDPKDFSLRIF